MRHAISFAAAIIAATLATPVSAQSTPRPLTPAQLAPASAAVVEGVIEERAKLLGCAAGAQRLRELVPTAWTEWRRTLLALLAANNFPAAHVQAMAVRTDPAKLDAPPAAPAAECAEAEFAKRIASFAATTWTDDIRATFKRQEMIFDIVPPTTEQWSKAKDVIAKEKAIQTKTFNCLAVVAPQLLGVTMQDWGGHVAALRALLLSRGYPRDEATALLDSIEPGALFSTAPRDRAALRAACEKDDVWLKRFFEFRMGAVVGDVREIVTGKR